MWITKLNKSDYCFEPGFTHEKKISEVFLYRQKKLFKKYLTLIIGKIESITFLLKQIKNTNSIKIASQLL